MKEKIFISNLDQIYYVALRVKTLIMNITFILQPV